MYRIVNRRHQRKGLIIAVELEGAPSAAFFSDASKADDLTVGELLASASHGVGIQTEEVDDCSIGRLDSVVVATGPTDASLVGCGESGR
jgi:hypothetical protein